MPESLSLKDLQELFYEKISGIKLNQLSNYDEFDDTNLSSPYPSLLVRKRKRLKGQQRPLTSHGTLNACLGLNQSHVPLVILTLENWHNAALHDGYEGVDNVGHWGEVGVTMGIAIVSPWAVIPALLYLSLSLWNVRAVIQKNIIYNENRIRYLKSLKQYKETNALPSNHSITEYEFNLAHRPLLEFNETQLELNPPKSFFRAAFIFGILFLSILPASWPIFLLTAVCAAIVTRWDYISQRSEINKDLAIKKLQWELIETQKAYIEKTRQEKGLVFDKINNTPTFNLDNRYVYTDHFFTVLGMNSGYLAFSFMTLFSLHQILPSMLVFLGVSSGLALATLFVLPAIACIIIGSYHAIQNQKLYDFYDAEIDRLRQENNEYETHLRALGYTGNIDQLVFLAKQTIALNAINSESKWSVKIFEGAKKIVRPWQFFGLFGLLSVIFAASLSATGIGLIIAMMVVASLFMGYADYKTREYKEGLESQINLAKETQINLLNKKSELLTRYKAKSTSSLAIDINHQSTEGNRSESSSPSSNTNKSPFTPQYNNARYAGAAAAAVAVTAIGAAAYYLPANMRNISQIKNLFK